MDNSRRIGLVTGGFDPLHSGHIDMIQEAKRTCSYLVVGINSDEWLTRKKGSYFMPWTERSVILESLRDVNHVIRFDDSDDSANDAIAYMKREFPNMDITFYNGGDREHDNILEIMKYDGDPQVHFEFATGGDYKKNASSVILQNWLQKQQQETQRNWGEYKVLQEGEGYKVKSLIVKPGESLSMQYHNDRNEHWFVAEGTASVEYQPGINNRAIVADYEKHNLLTVPEGCWHKLSNKTAEDLIIVEIQYGDRCEENDITRAE